MILSFLAPRRRGSDVCDGKDWEESSPVLALLALFKIKEKEKNARVQHGDFSLLSSMTLETT
jgi:hypothetical protein